ncbi:Cell surface glycoprotein 1 [Diplonema papillatum]|nr:Cell surface glycoprotein 1 [Diplonema papillatum]
MPHLFPVYRGTRDSLLPLKTMSPKLKHTLIFRRGSRHGRDANFAFLCFNQMQRFALARSHAHVRLGHNDVFDRLMKTPNLLDRIKAAILDPDAKSSLDLRKLVGRCLQFTMRAVPFSSARRRGSLLKMQALTFFSGLPSVFVTVSPADMDMPMTFRVVHGRNDVHPLPDLPLRAATVVDNAAVATETFRQMMTALLETVMGVCAVNSTTRTTMTSATSGVITVVGIFGVARAQFSVVEVQGRGALHLHGIVWTPYTPDDLTKKLQDPALAPELQRRMDFMFHTRRMEKQEPRAPLQSHPAASPLTAYDTPEYRGRLDSVVSRMQFHNRCTTGCYKNGAKCRSALPAPPVEETGVYLIEEDHDEKGEYVRSRLVPVPAAEPVDPAAAPKHVFPYPEEETRPIVVATRRPPEDAAIVPFSPVLSAVTGSNTAVYSLGCPPQAETIMFYLLKYLTKDLTAVDNTLVVFKTAFDLAQRYKSLAADADTDPELRAKKLLMARFGNKHLGAVEVSAQMAFAAILDHPSEYCSHDFAGVSVWAGVRYLCGTAAAVPKEEKKTKPEEEEGTAAAAAAAEDSDDDDDSDDEGGGEDEDPEVKASACVDDDKDSDDDDDDNDSLNTFEGSEYGGEAVDVDAEAARATNPVDLPDGKAPVSVDPVEAYAHRGLDLESLCLYEYIMLFKAEKKKVSPAEELGAPPPLPSHTVRRKANLRVQFVPSFRLAATHVQVLRSKLCVPMLFGARCPKPPLTSDPHHRRKAVKHAQYMATLFRPWTFGDAGNANAGFATPEAWIAHYQSMTGVCKKWADNVATILRSNSEMRLAVSRWRFSRARMQGAKGDLPPLPERPDEEKDLDELHEKYGSDVDEILLLREQIAKEDPATLFLGGFLESVGSLVFPASAAAVPAAATAPASASAPAPKPQLPLVGWAESKASLTELQALNGKEEDDVELLYEAMNPNPFQPASPEPIQGIPEPPPGLDESQQAAFRAIVRAVLVAYPTDQPADAPSPKLVILHGGPGCGKSFLMKSARAAMALREHGKTIAGATTGIAAVNIDGETVSRLCLLYKAELVEKDVAALKKLFTGVHGLFIDEMSMLRASELSLVERRLRLATGSPLPFGGIAVILVGDFFQLPPVKGVRLFARAAGGKPHEDRSIGDFALFELGQQHRVDSGAPGAQAHIDRINRMRDPSTCEQAIKELTGTARRLNPGDSWPEDASLLVACNAEAAAATKFLAQKFALEKGVPVACFSVLKDRKKKPGRDEELFFFVPGAPGVVTGNISVAKKVANGTRCRMVALSYECPGDEQRAASAFENASPGQLVMVPPPKYIIVDVNGKRVPVERSWRSEEPVKKRGKPLRSALQNFKVLPGWALTFWRCQALTLSNVVIDLHRRPPTLGKITFEAFYVAVSRVTSPEDLYLLAEREDGAFDWVAKKTPSPDLIAWLRSRCPGRYPDVPPQQKKAAPKRSSAPARKKPAAKLSAAAKRAASDQPAGPPPAKKPAAKLSAKRAGGHPQPAGQQKRAKPAEGPAAAAADASSNPAASSSSSARPPPAAKKPAAKHPAAAKRAASSCQPGQKKAKFASSSSLPRALVEPLTAIGLTHVPVVGDGACFFSAVAIAVGSDAATVRREIVQFVQSNPRHYARLPAGWTQAMWIASMSRPFVWADDLAINAAADMYDKDMYLLTVGSDGDRVLLPILRSNAATAATGGDPILLLHHAGSHFDLLVAEQAFDVGIALLWNSAPLPDNRVAVRVQPSPAPEALPKRAPTPEPLPNEKAPAPESLPKKAPTPEPQVQPVPAPETLPKKAPAPEPLPTRAPAPEPKKAPTPEPQPVQPPVPPPGTLPKKTPAPEPLPTRAPAPPEPQVKSPPAPLPTKAPAPEPQVQSTPAPLPEKAPATEPQQAQQPAPAPKALPKKAPPAPQMQPPPVPENKKETGPKKKGKKALPTTDSRCPMPCNGCFVPRTTGKWTCDREGCQFHEDILDMPGRKYRNAVKPGQQAWHCVTCDKDFCMKSCAPSPSLPPTPAPATVSPP